MNRSCVRGTQGKPDNKSEYAESKMQVWQGSDQDYKYLNSNNVHLNSDDARFKGAKVKRELREWAEADDWSWSN